MSRIRANLITNQSADGAPTVQNGLVISGVTTSTNVSVASSVTATTYYGSGVNLTGITGTTINNNANNRVITGSGTANTLEGEANLTYDGSKFGIGTNSPDQTVHIHKGSAGSIDSTATSVLTLENSTTAVLQFLTPNNVSAQLRFGDPQDNGAGFIDYSHTSNTMAFGVYGPTRMQLDSNGHLGLDVASTTQLANSKMLTLRPGNDDGIRFVRPGDGSNIPNVHLDLTTTTSGSAFPTGEAYTTKYKTTNCDQIFETIEGGGTGGNISFRTQSASGESLRIDKDGTLTTPKHPIFATRINYVNAYVNSGTKIQMKAAHIDTRSSFSDANDRYVAPSAGRYLFYFFSNIDYNGDGTIAVRFVRNGSEFTGTEGGHIYSYAQNSGWHGLCGQIITNMAVNDYMEVYTAANNMKVDGNNYGQFGGYMIG